VILEEPISKTVFVKRRIKKLGLWKVLGQILFQLFIVKILDATSVKRKKKILSGYGLDESEIPGDKIIPVSSVNDKASLDALQRLQPDLVIVNGTRIITRQILNSIPAKFINTHVGITPKYRGVHGGYWALANNDRENCGVTIHFVDPGIDTGEIIYQKNIEPSSADNFSTYPLLQLAEGIPLLKKAIRETFNDTVVTKTATTASKLWHHPTIWQYFQYRAKGIK
jgi:methionyl-tRNA formyltransferase